MPEFPECDSVKMFCDSPEGDGNCSACRGTGFFEFCDAIALGLLNMEQPYATSGTVPAYVGLATEWAWSRRQS
jgi:hypothetical protein